MPRSISVVRLRHQPWEAARPGYVPPARQFWRPPEWRTLDEAIQSARRIIRTALVKSRRAYIAYSGGKDSAVLRHLVRGVAPGNAVVEMWSDNELEFPEVIDHMAAHPSLIHLAGHTLHAGWFAPWAEWPLWRDIPPGMVWPQMDVRSYMRTQGCDTAFVGLRCGESVRRYRYLQGLADRGTPGRGAYRTAHGTLRQVHPLWDWTDGDVWAYIEQCEVPIVSVYARMRSLGVPRHLQRVGPLPLASPDTLRRGWPEVSARLISRYPGRWEDA